MIHSMERMDDMTSIIMVGGCRYTVKETPEEILSTPDIEQSNKVIDWEQRRYEIAKEVMALYCMDETDYSIENRAADAIIAANTLVDSLKHEQEND